MAHVILSKKCTACGSCADVCPVDCIKHSSEDSQYPKFYIDPETCIDCGACMPECPVNAIKDEKDVGSEDITEVEVNAKFFSEGPGYGED